MAKSEKLPSDTVEFSINRIDQFGNGVDDSKIPSLFLPGTLTGDSGSAKVTLKRSKFQRGEVINFTQESPNKVKPECPHFEICSGCHLLHTDYENEKQIKLNHFERGYKTLFKAPEDKVEVQYLDAIERTGYRNRVQLHYDLKKNIIGFKAATSNEIIEVPDCKIAGPAIEELLQKFYQDYFWKTFLGPNENEQGHIEIYEHPKSGEVQVSVNEKYAEGGFSQVNQPMNEALLKTVSDKIYQDIVIGKDFWVFDLFGGDGNLSDELSKSHPKTMFAIVDQYPQKQKKSDNKLYLSHNLLSDNPLNSFKQRTPSDLKLSGLIVDPPRKGFPALKDFALEYNPEWILYVSCNSSTLIRDLQNLTLNNYKISQCFIVDFFPSTTHYESLIFLKRI